MSGFGGSIKLTGEDAYQKALRQITQNLREVSSEMKVVSSSYDKNDKSTAALTAKEEVLNKKLTEQENKLNVLNKQYEKMSSEYAEQTNKHNALVKTYDAEKEKLEQIGKELGTSSKEYQAQKAKVDELAQEVTKSTKAQDDNEKSMSRMRVEINNAQADCNKTAKELDNLGHEATESGKEAKGAGDGFTVLKGALANLAAQAATTAINGLKRLGSTFINVGKQALSSYADYEQLVGGVETLFGTGGKSLETYAKSVGKTTDEARGEYYKLEAAQKEVLANASNAYKTAGMDANSYMETVTSFSAALVSSLDGDTAKAAKAADLAITDMSDNANKMGTDIQSIQNAYQGFAKGNYTMLDNLKLGFSGSKEGMEQLLAKAEEISGIKYDISSLSDVYDAIHVVQTEMGITGTTAKEAASTISGSVGMMSASWQNLLTGIADENQDFGKLVDNFVESLVTVAHNMLPRIKNIMDGLGTLVSELVSKLLPEIITMINDNSDQMIQSATNLITALGDGILQALPVLIPIALQVVMNIVNQLIANLPQIIDVGMQVLIQFIQGLTLALPQLIQMLPTIITTTVSVIMKNLPLILSAGITLLVELVRGITKALPQLIAYIPTLIKEICNVIEKNLPQLLVAGVSILLEVINGIIKCLPQLVKMIPTIIQTIVSTLINLGSQLIDAGGKILSSLMSGISSKFGDLKQKAQDIAETIMTKVKEIPTKIVSIGTDIVKGIWNGISNGTQWIKDKIKEWVGNVTNFIKKVFKIGSPSKLMEDEVGQWLAKGIGVGFEDEMNDVASQMADAIPTNFDIDANVVKGSAKKDSAYGNMVASFKQALSEMKIELDSEVAGQFVDKTVSRLIYT